MVCLAPRALRNCAPSAPSGASARPLNFTVRRAVARVLLNVVAPVVALVCCAASVYFILPTALALFALPQYAPGLRGLIVAAIGFATGLMGLVAALFLYPLVLRPLISGSEFWGWLGERAPINLPVVNRLLLRWYEYLYGPRHV